MKKAGALLGGLAIGAGLVYFLDPERGEQRRDQVRERVVRGLDNSKEFLDEARHDLSHRAKDLAAGVQSRVRHLADDDVLPEEGAPGTEAVAELRRGNWTPGVQLLSGLASGVALIYGSSFLRSHMPQSASLPGRRRR